MSVLPEIDIHGLFMGNSSKDKQTSTDIYSALVKTGACYVRGHGISEDFLDDFRSSSKKFFEQDDAIKERFIRHHLKGDYLGWTKSETEHLSSERPPDLREAFNYSPSESPDIWKKWAESLDGDFRKHCEVFFEDCSHVALKLLKCLTTAMGVEGTSMPQFQESQSEKIILDHSLVGLPGNISEMRSTYQMPTFDKTVKPKQIRLVEHSDFGTLSLFFQDGEEGFQIFSRESNTYIDVKPVKNSCVLYAGDMLQFYSADRLTATKHRVLMPVGETHTHKVKQDFVFYLGPNKDATVEPVDGSGKYPSRKYIDLLDERMQQTWN